MVVLQASNDVKAWYKVPWLNMLFCILYATRVNEYVCRNVELFVSYMMLPALSLVADKVS